MGATLRIHPELQDQELLRIFDRATERQWSSALLPWSQPEPWDRVSRQALTAILTPVYLGEQTAMLGVSAMLPKMASEHQPEAALCLASMGMDEARHFRNLHRLFTTWQTQPLTTRQLPDMWRYHARLLQSGDPVHWLWGILISDLFASRFYGQLAEQYGDLLVGRLARRTVRDEARHQAFADRVLQQRMASWDREAKRSLLVLRDGLFGVMDRLTRKLDAPLADLGWSGTAFLEALREDVERWVGRLHLNGEDGGAEHRSAADGRPSAAVERALDGHS